MMLKILCSFKRRVPLLPLQPVGPPLIVLIFYGSYGRRMLIPRTFGSYVSYGRVRVLICCLIHKMLPSTSVPKSQDISATVSKSKSIRTRNYLRDSLHTITIFPMPAIKVCLWRSVDWAVLRQAIRTANHVTLPISRRDL